MFLIMEIITYTSDFITDFIITNFSISSELLSKILWYIYFSVFIALFLSATVHHHLGLRKKYIEFLLRIFEFGQKRVERKRIKVHQRLGVVDEELSPDFEKSFEVLKVSLENQNDSENDSENPSSENEKITENELNENENVCENDNEKLLIKSENPFSENEKLNKNETLTENELNENEKLTENENQNENPFIEKNENPSCENEKSSIKSENKNENNQNLDNENLKHSEDKNLKDIEILGNDFVILKEVNLQDDSKNTSEKLKNEEKSSEIYENPSKRQNTLSENSDAKTENEEKLQNPDQNSENSKFSNNGFKLDAILDYLRSGISVITDDSFSKSFESEELPYWNLLSRTNTQNYEFISFRLTAFWLTGLIFRYCVLFPLRLLILLIGILLVWIVMVLIGLIPECSFKRFLYRKCMVFTFDFIAGSLSLVATFHNEENAPYNGIAVANHTSPIDSLILATHNCYDMVGQKHGGLLGFLMMALSHASSHIWFERGEAKDRALVIKRMKEHADDPELPAILIFPEGVCVNNTSVMQFKKGAFEIASVVHPIAIRFDARFGDAFWWQDKFIHYVLCMMTSWAIVCNVWYLPPMTRQPNESAIAFANRVKAKIARQGGMIDLSWDGFLKAQPIKQEWRKQKQEEFAKNLHVIHKEKEE